VLRGQAQPSTAGDNVGVFIDGVYQAERTTIDVAPLDVERVEVVRGPQNTLFGHSTFAGALHYVPRAPTPNVQHGVELGIGTDGYAAASGFLSGPVLQDRLLGRIAAGAWHASGTVENSAGNETLGGYGRAALAATLESAGDGPLHARLSGRWSETRSSQPPTSTVGPAQYNCGAFDPAVGAWSYYCGALPLAGSPDLSPGIPDSRSDASQVMLALDWEQDDWQLSSQTSYYRGASTSYRDFDASSTGELFGVCAFPDGCPRAQDPPQPVSRLQQVDSVSRQSPVTEEWGQEMRLGRNTGGEIDWTLGLAWIETREGLVGALGFERGRLAATERLTVLLPLTPALAGPIARANAALVEDPDVSQVLQSKSATARRTLAAFGTLDYRPVDRVSLRAELRSTWERVSLDSEIANFAPSFGEAIDAQHFTDVTPRLSIDVRPRENLFLYAAAAKGSRSGGINPIPDLQFGEQTFEPEYNWTYELGGRYRDPLERWRGGATLYYIDWRNTQLLGFATTPGIAGLIIRNTAGVTTPGAELSFDARLAPNLALHASYSYAEPEFVSGSDDPGSSAFCGLRADNQTSSFCTVGPPRSGPTLPGMYVPYVDGNSLQRAPHRQWYVGLRGDFQPFRSGWRVVPAVDLSHQDDVFDRAINGARYGERTLLSGRIGLARHAWTVEFWGTNLTDELYVRSVSSRGAAFYPVSPRPLDLVYGEGRRFGVTVRYEP
jgi:iron complex outermembrane receptor protein